MRCCRSLKLRTWWKIWLAQLWVESHLQLFFCFQKCCFTFFYVCDYCCFVNSIFYQLCQHQCFLQHMLRCHHVSAARAELFAVRPCATNKACGKAVFQRKGISTQPWRLFQRWPLIRSAAVDSGSIPHFSFFNFCLSFGDGNWVQAEAWIELLAGAVEVNALAQGAIRQFTQWLWIEHPTFQLGGGDLTTELLPLTYQFTNPKFPSR